MDIFQLLEQFAQNPSIDLYNQIANMDVPEYLGGNQTRYKILDQMNQMIQSTLDPNDFDTQYQYAQSYANAMIPQGMPDDLRSELEQKISEQFQTLSPEKEAEFNYKQFTDPNSNYYQELRKEIQRAISDTSTTMGTLVGGLRAQGVSGGGSNAIAQEQREAIERRNAEEVGSALSQAQLQGAQMGTQGLFNIAQLREQRRQFNEQLEASQPSFFEQIASPLGTALGLLIPGLGSNTNSITRSSSTPFAGERSPMSYSNYQPFNFRF